MDTFNGTWTRDGNTLTLKGYADSVSASLSGNKLILNQSLSTSYPMTCELSKSEASGTGNTTLKIQNESFSEITEVRWSNVSFTQGTESITNGSHITKNVQEGNGYIYFKRSTYPINARTDEIIIIEKNEQKVIVINDNTIIVDADNPNNKGTFGTLTKESQITVQADGSAIAQFGDYDFGSSLFNTNKDVTFTIGNSGKTDLKFNVVGDNVINLSNNASGYFSVVQQPFASMPISPGSTTTFVIRFSPKTVGNNFNAEVTIVTNNSENDSEFTFTVKGSGRNYMTGDIGPAGGYIFYDKGTVGWRFMEVAPETTEFTAQWGAFDIDVTIWALDSIDLNLPGSTYSTVGTGKGNTNLIVALLNQRGEANRAAQRCKDLVFGGYKDWFLPSIDDFIEIDNSLYRKGLGGFGTGDYWSSSQANSGSAKSFNFSYSEDHRNKTGELTVRAVRSF